MIHEPARLRLTSLLAGVDRMAFSQVASALGVSKSVLSKHARVLQESGYLQLSKEPQDARGTRAWLALTDDGRRALAGHLAALRAITAGVDGLV
ncbi:transcriptional regulator [Nocardioides nanhaiensis]|uniref:Transcriptional regulator n=1 Tax=Nocardioides nanhaiensis TaxID=1476871 RepID=A0ABP8VTM0_9ACTN